MIDLVLTLTMVIILILLDRPRVLFLFFFPPVFALIGRNNKLLTYLFLAH